MRFFSFLFSVKNHFSHFTLEMEKLSFLVEKRTSELRKWQIDRQQDNFSFLCLTLFAFGFQEIVPNFRWPLPQFWAFKPLKSVRQKWWRKACVFFRMLWPFWWLFWIVLKGIQHLGQNFIVHLAMLASSSLIQKIFCYWFQSRRKEAFRRFVLDIYCVSVLVLFVWGLHNW